MEAMPPPADGIPLDSPPRARIPAWAASWVLHVVAVLALSLMPNREPKSLPGEPDRAVGIVLAKAEGAQKKYFEEPPSDSQADSAAPSASPAKSPSESAPEGAATPARESPESLQIADLALPGRANTSANQPGDLFVPSIGLPGGKRPSVLPGLDDAAILAEDAARPRPKGRSGPLGEVELFGAMRATGRAFVFIIDRSTSMGGDGLGALEAAGTELHSQVGRLLPEHEFQIIAYNNRLAYLSGGKSMLPATPENVATISPFFGGLAAFGKTEHLTALRAALRLDPEVVVILTDGGDPELTNYQIDDVVRQAAKRTTIHAIQFGAGPKQTPSFLELLASKTGGSYAYIDVNQRRK